MGWSGDMKYVVYDALKQPFKQCHAVIEARTGFAARLAYATDAEIEVEQCVSLRLDLLSAHERELLNV